MKKIFIIMFVLSICIVSSSIAAPIISTTLNCAFNSGDVTNFDIIQTPDNVVTFGYNWSTLTTDPTSGYAYVPTSPHGDVIGLRVEVNNTGTADYQEGVTIYPKVAPTAPEYDIEVDAWIAYTIPIAGGGTGSTEHLGIVVEASGTKLCTLRDNALNNVNPSLGYSSDTEQDGVAFGYNGDEGEARSTFWCFKPDTRTDPPGTLTENGQAGTWTGATSVPVGADAATGKFMTNVTFPEDVVYFNAFTFPAGRDTTTAGSATPGYVWNTLKASVRNNLISFYVNDVLFCTVNSSLTAKKVGIICTDSFISVSTPPEESYMLFDNFKITEITYTTSVKENWMLYN